MNLDTPIRCPNCLFQCTLADVETPLAERVRCLKCRVYMTPERLPEPSDTESWLKRPALFSLLCLLCLPGFSPAQSRY